LSYGGKHRSFAGLSAYKESSTALWWQNFESNK